MQPATVRREAAISAHNEALRTMAAAAEDTAHRAAVKQQVGANRAASARGEFLWPEPEQWTGAGVEHPSHMTVDLARVLCSGQHTRADREQLAARLDISVPALNKAFQYSTRDDSKHASGRSLSPDICRRLGDELGVVWGVFYLGFGVFQLPGRTRDGQRHLTKRMRVDVLAAVADLVTAGAPAVITDGLLDVLEGRVSTNDPITQWGRPFAAMLYWQRTRLGR